VSLGRYSTVAAGCAVAVALGIAIGMAVIRLCDEIDGYSDYLFDPASNVDHQWKGAGE